MAKKILVLLFVAIVGLAGWQVLSKHSQNRISSNINATNEPTRKNAQQSSDFDKTKYSTDEPGSLWWVVNKKRPLPDGYVPNNLVVPNVQLRLSASAEQMHLRKDAAKAIEQLFDDAKRSGKSLYLASGYRSASYQKQLYESYVIKDGKEKADRYSARPGTSEHQTGMAADVGRIDGKCELEICFGETPEGKWLRENAHRYGFIIRYLQGKEDFTTYQSEPWHLRYVGQDLAIRLKDTGQSMEEFFGLEG